MNQLQNPPDPLNTVKEVYSLNNVYDVKQLGESWRNEAQLQPSIRSEWKSMQMQIEAKITSRQDSVLSYSVNHPNEKKKAIREQLPKLEGQLLKKSPHWIQGYSAVWCVVENRELRYYKIDKKTLLGVLNFDVQCFEYTEVWNDNGEVVEFKLKPSKTKKIFQFKLEQQGTIQKWCDVIKLHLNNSIGKLQNLTKLATLEKFWKVLQDSIKRPIISVQQFEDVAKDGDLILFQGKHLNNKLQRFVTASEYDHIALVVVIEGQIKLFESLPNQGVSLSSWKSFIHEGYESLYEKISYRQLEVNRTLQFKDKLIQFIRNNINKNHCVELGKLFQLTSQFQETEDRTYFASELIAKCYKRIDLLPPQKSSTQYWVRTFAQEIQLINAQLNPEAQINFI